MLNILFWFCFVLILYIYIGYPLLVKILGKLINLKVDKKDYQPTVSIITAAFNEAQFIAETIENKLSQDYPQEKIEIIVVSDESEDGTDEIIQQYSDRNVKYFRQVPRQGKTSAINLAVSQATGDIIIFSDANSLYKSDVVKQIVKNFDNEDVGYVTGKMIYVNKDKSSVGDGCTAYMKYENFLRKHESLIGSVVGVDGGIDAVRRDLYEEMNADQIPDFVQPLKIVKKGFRVIYDAEAILMEEALSDQKKEYKMRVRVGLRSLWALLDMRCLLNPFKYKLFSLQLFSHKVLRYFAWFPLLLLLITNLCLFNQSIFYAIIFIAQLLFYALAFIGYQLQSGKSLPIYFSAPYYFILINLASAHASMKFFMGEKQVIWVPRSG